MNALKNILSFGTVYELPIARGYVRHWKMTEAVREILQNAIDSESPFEYNIDEEDDGSYTLWVHSRYSHLTPDTLLLGKTSKADDKDSIGSFGEGYKIALLVLAREGFSVEVRNRDRVWRPVFKHSNTFKTEVLCIEDAAAPFQNEGVSFVIGGLSPADVDKIRDSCLFMQKNIGRTTQTPKANILRDRPGKLYVGGLFVCNTKLMFGYDVKPEYLKLERDRQTVSDFDLKYLTKSIWFDTDNMEEVAKLMEVGTPDLEYSEYGAPQIVKDACYKLFKEKHPGKVVAKDQQELEAFVKKGLEVVVYAGGFHAAVSTHQHYTNAFPSIRARTPQEVLRDWLTDNRAQLPAPCIESFSRIIESAESWRR